MNEQDELKLARAITALAIAFQKPVSEGLIAAYRMGLDDLPIRDIERAVARAMREHKFFPTVAELRALSGVLAPEDRFLAAWRAIETAQIKESYYGTVDFDDKAINAVVHQLGGWETFSDRFDKEDHVWLKKECERVYASFCRNGVPAEMARPCGGLHNRNNHSRFPEHVPAPTLVESGLHPTPVIGDWRDPRSKVVEAEKPAPQLPQASVQTEIKKPPRVEMTAAEFEERKRAVAKQIEDLR
jgi:hypothetical protein